MKLCKNCKNRIDAYTPFYIYGNRCKKGYFMKDPVNGKVTYLTSCSDMRSNICGKEAKLFEPSTWYKIKTFFRKG